MEIRSTKRKDGHGMNISLVKTITLEHILLKKWIQKSHGYVISTYMFVEKTPITIKLETTTGVTIHRLKLKVGQ